MKTRGALDRNDFPIPERQTSSANVVRQPDRRPVVDPEGREYPSLRQAARAYRLTPMGILYRATLGLAGWRFAEPTPDPATRRPR